MTTQDSKTVTPETSSTSTPSQSGAALATTRPFYPASIQRSPLPGNRPIADNVTEDMDDMLGYLD